MPDVALRLLTRDAIPVTVQTREQRGKGAMGKLRREQGRIPGIIYGHDQPPFAFHTDARELGRIFSKNGQSILLAVGFQETENPLEQAIVREVQYHKVTGEVLHIDLLRIDPTERRVITVPIHTLGIPEGVRTGGGAVQHAVTALEMDCVISEMPSAIEIDISSLEIGDSVHISDLLARESRIVTDPEVAIVSVLAPRLTVDEEQAADEEEALEGEVEGEEGEVEGEEGEGGGEDQAADGDAAQEQQK
jgi:large subunit ribosomal protein L25